MNGHYVFPSRLDSKKHLTTVQKLHEKACREANLEFRLYDLRHTFGSRAAMAGVDLPTLKELMGHGSITITMRYVHPTPAHKMQAVQKLQQFNLEKVSETCPESHQKSHQSVVYCP
jgi:integrase